MTDTKKFWQWLVERAKKDKIAAKSPTDLDKWINGLLAEIDDMDNWENDNWWYNKFGVVKMGSKEILKLKHKAAELLSECTGKNIKQIHKDTDRDNYMSAEEACEYGIVDEVCRPN